MSTRSSSTYFKCIVFFIHKPCLVVSQIARVKPARGNITLIEALIEKRDDCLRIDIPPVTVQNQFSKSIALQLKAVPGEAMHSENPTAVTIQWSWSISPLINSDVRSVDSLVCKLPGCINPLSFKDSMTLSRSSRPASLSQSSSAAGKRPAHKGTYDETEVPTVSTNSAPFVSTS